LFDQLTARGFDKVAAVSGDTSRIWNETYETKNFETILERFAPFTKLFREKEWAFEASSKEIPIEKQYEEWKGWIAENDKKALHKLQNTIDILIAKLAIKQHQFIFEFTRQDRATNGSHETCRLRS
jgi:hypothetical protein